nr:MAG TPA: hypothetical protein [Caudoviricetes sp.]
MKLVMPTLTHSRHRGLIFHDFMLAVCMCLHAHLSVVH